MIAGAATRKRTFCNSPDQACRERLNVDDLGLSTKAPVPVLDVRSPPARILLPRYDTALKYDDEPTPLLMNPINLLKRAFASPSATKLSEGEAVHYAAAGISEPAIQRYMAWRRALIFMVVIATVLSAGLTTYRNLTEEDDDSDLIESLTEPLKEKFGKMLPTGAEQKVEEIKAKVDDLKPAVDKLKEKAGELKEKGDELKEKTESPKPPQPPQGGKSPTSEALDKIKKMQPLRFNQEAPTPPKVEKEDEKEKEEPDAKAKAKADKEDDEEEKPKAGAEKSKTGKDDAEEVEEIEKPKNTFEKFTDIMESAPLYVLAVMALMALFVGNNLRLSYKFLVAGFLFGFLLPMAIAVCPWSWFGEKEVSYSLAKDPVNFLKDFAEGLMEGGHYLVMLLPTVLSLVPGVLKGCMKVKNLLPQSLLPGWFVVMAAPLYGLFLLVIFIAVDQVTAEPLILAGLGLVVLAHFVYVFRAEAFTAPLLGEADQKRLKSAMLTVTAITAAGGILLLTFLLTRQVMGVHLFGTDPKKALMQPLDLVEYALEFVARSMFMTALSVDLFMRMNLAAWRHIRALAGAPGAMEYQQSMDALEKVVG